MIRRRTGEPVCPICHDPLTPTDQWETLICPTIRDGNSAVHVTCLWSLEENIR